MKDFLTSFLRDESGASAAEYALILAIIGGLIVVGSLALGGAIGDSMQGAADCINAGAACEADAPADPG